MRARLLKPGFFMNEELARLPVRARLLFAGLWCLADREGRLEDRPDRIRAAIFPYERVRVDDLLARLEKAGFVKRYQSASTCCIALPQFAKHQRPHHRESESTLPPEPRQGTAQPQPGLLDPVTRSGKDLDQDQEITASRPVPFKVYAAIANRVLRQCEDIDIGGLALSDFAEELKRAFAREGLPYSATTVQKTIDAVIHMRAKERRA
jgi:hypothetical protein